MLTMIEGCWSQSLHCTRVLNCLQCRAEAGTEKSNYHSQPWNPTRANSRLVQLRGWDARLVYCWSQPMHRLELVQVQCWAWDLKSADFQSQAGTALVSLSGSSAFLVLRPKNQLIVSFSTGTALKLTGDWHDPTAGAKKISLSPGTTLEPVGDSGTAPGLGLDKQLLVSLSPRTTIVHVCSMEQSHVSSKHVT